MTNDPRHPVDDLQELLDERLDPLRRREVVAHVDACATCREELESLRAMRALLRSELPDLAVPGELEAAVTTALDREAAGTPAPRPGLARRRPRLLAWTLAAAAILLLAFWATTRRPDDGRALVRDVVTSGRTWRATTVVPGHVTSDVHDLEGYYAEQLPFGVTVYDLGAMDYDLLGGRVERVADRQSAAFAYQGPARRVVCHMFLGSLDELPPDGERRTIDGRTFLVYHDGADTVVFWAEGRVICAFVGDLPADDVVGLAVAKASKAPTAS